MKLPGTLRILGQDWTVNLEAAQRDGRLGHTDLAKLTMDVCEDQAPGQIRDTLLHELLHACMNAVGLGREDREDIVYGLTPVLLDALRANPELVAFLTEP